MTTSMNDDLDAVIAQLCQCHPRFPRGAVERLVGRIVASRDHEPSPDRLAAVRQAAERQLAYVEQIPAV